MKLALRNPSTELAADASNLRTVLHDIYDAFRRVALANNQPDNGTTAARPTSDLAVGQTYFDTDLNQPIWWDGTQWVDSTGAPA